jgi:V/A-type H+/Na+-transporting ATPase subunit C
MSDFDYGNARLHAMKSRLLSQHELETLADNASLPGLIAALTRTSYRKQVEAALTRASGLDCINEALRLDLTGTLGNIRSFYQDQAVEMVAIVLRTYDIHNLKTILRGLTKNLPPGDILPVLLPVGDLNYYTLADLTRASGPRGAIDILASMNFPIAQPLLRLRVAHPGADVFDMELALDQWYFLEAYSYLKDTAQSDETLFATLRLDADILNLLTVLRFAHAPTERKLPGSRSGLLETNRLFVGPGRLSFATLSRAASEMTIKAAVETLAGTPYEGPLRNGLQAYVQSNQVSSLEKHLKRFRLDWTRRLIAKDPLGIGVLIGYLALKINEVGNIRWIANGINLGLKPNAIRLELELVT